MLSADHNRSECTRFRPSHSVNDYLVTRRLHCASSHGVFSIAQLFFARQIGVLLILRADGMRRNSLWAVPVAE